MEAQGKFGMSIAEWKCIILMLSNLKQSMEPGNRIGIFDLICGSFPSMRFFYSAFTHLAFRISQKTPLPGCPESGVESIQRV